MAVYATRAQLELAVGTRSLVAIADRDNDGEPDSEVVDAALAQASSVVDSYLTAYLPNVTIVAPLTQATIAIGFELLHSADQSTEDSRLGYDRAISWLKDIAKGIATLPGQVAVETSEDAPSEPLVSSGDRMWSRDVARLVF